MGGIRSLSIALHTKRPLSQPQYRLKNNPIIHLRTHHTLTHTRHPCHKNKMHFATLCCFLKLRIYNEPAAATTNAADLTYPNSDETT